MPLNKETKSNQRIYSYMASSLPIKYELFSNRYFTQKLDRVSLGVMALKAYVTLPISAELEPPYQMQFSVIFRTPLLREESPHQGLSVA